MTPARFEIGQKHKQENEAGSKASWNTPRSDSRPTMSYPSRMALAFALTSLMTVLVLVAFSATQVSANAIVPLGCFILLRATAPLSLIHISEPTRH